MCLASIPGPQWDMCKVRYSTNFNQESKDTEKLLHLPQDNRSERSEVGKVSTFLMFQAGRGK